ncbi:hypothetical protein B296_00041098 [Ensete ventricosum]|uniref:MSP domain-containing protein n=1 Tax=Ensete ventricosum TaxID=4639 RepID=A0A426ZGA5_ENSVE|nr:hypothetical protein B296_00041098 [Ensete ventricosum]
MAGGGQMISVYPEELTFECTSLLEETVELEKPSYCNIKVVNNTEHHVAFKVFGKMRVSLISPRFEFVRVKTTSPKKYFVRPNASVVQPWDSCAITGIYVG